MYDLSLCSLILIYFYLIPTYQNAYLTDRIRQLLPVPLHLRSCKQSHVEQAISWKVAKRYFISLLGKEVLCCAQDAAFWRLYGNH